MSISLSLGTSQIGLSLEAQLIDTTGANVGSPVTSGFFEVGLGNYLFNGSFPVTTDTFSGAVVFKKLDGTVMGLTSVNIPNDVVLDPAGLDSIDIDGMNARQVLAIMGAALAGKLSLSGGPNNVTIDSIDGSTPRITATVLDDGERTSITLSPPA